MKFSTEDIKEFCRQEMLKRSKEKNTEILTYENKYKFFCKLYNIKEEEPYQTLLVLKMKEISDSLTDLREKDPRWKFFFKVIDLDFFEKETKYMMFYARLFSIFREVLLNESYLLIEQEPVMGAGSKEYVENVENFVNNLEMPLKDSEIITRIVFSIKFELYIKVCCHILAHIGQPKMSLKDLLRPFFNLLNKDR